jgi:4-alpha-glucanotransferase
VFDERASGVLCHPTSLPGPHGIGTIGEPARRLAGWLCDHRQRYWQMLPLTPTRYEGDENNCPYCSSLVFDRSEWLIDLPDLQEDELIDRRAFRDVPDFPAHRVDFLRLMPWKATILGQAATNFHARRSDLLVDYAAFCQRRSYLDDSGLYLALREEHGGRPWPTWEVDLRDRESRAIRTAKERLAGAIEAHKLKQFFFYRQWARLRETCRKLGILLLGDLPFYVAMNNVATWTDREQFMLDAVGKALVVSGVPADYYNAKGQFWNNPIYNWLRMAADGFRWLLARVLNELDDFDGVRLDHFRAFDEFWEIPAGATSALEGAWKPGPGMAFVNVLHAACNQQGMRTYVEDLGNVGKRVRLLVELSRMACSRVVQLGFKEQWDMEDLHLPHNHPENAVVFPWTHDNASSRGWYSEVAGSHTGHHFRLYAGTDGTDANWTMIRLAMFSRARTLLVPAQDLAKRHQGPNADPDDRMNRPGEPKDNWQWRLLPDDLTSEMGARLLWLTKESGRCAA